MEKNRTIAQHGGYVRRLESQSRLPVTGYVIQEGATTGAYGDGWIASEMTLQLRPTEPVRSLKLHVYRPEEAGGGRVRILIDGVEMGNSVIDAGPSEVAAQFTRGKDEAFTLQVLFEAEQPWRPPGDDRDLALMMMKIRVEHPTPEIPKTRRRRLFRW